MADGNGTFTCACQRPPTPLSVPSVPVCVCVCVRVGSWSGECVCAEMLSLTAALLYALVSVSL